MGCGIAIREGQPALTQTEEEAILRERKKVFTDFHNMGIDSTSAFLGGDDSSVHQRSQFLSSMAYPVGSSGGKGEVYSICLIVCLCLYLLPQTLWSNVCLCLKRRYTILLVCKDPTVWTVTKSARGLVCHQSLGQLHT
jgi:hypothetical protein